VNLTPELEAEYVQRFNSLVISEHNRQAADLLAYRLMESQSIYANVETATGVPFYVVGLFHCMEADFDFDTHLHNGDPLSNRTVHVPRGRPVNGSPPFTWQESAIDALAYDAISSWKLWTVSGIAFCLEKFNGFGYRRKDINIPSPYLWSGSTHYIKGKFESDGRYNPNLVSDQIGAMVILERLSINHDIALKGLKPDA
jgi:lysozyme family protein